jgi:hypothetical protein
MGQLIWGDRSPPGARRPLFTAESSLCGYRQQTASGRAGAQTKAGHAASPGPLSAPESL